MSPSVTDRYVPLIIYTKLIIYGIFLLLRCGLDSFTRLNWNKYCFFYHYSCGLSTATIEYSCPSVCLSVCLGVCLGVFLCVCLSVYTITQNNGSIDLKLEHIVVYKNSSDEFDIGHCPIKVKVTAWLWNFSLFTTIPTVKAYISALAHTRKLWLSMSVNHIIIYKIY